MSEPGAPTLRAALPMYHGDPARVEALWHAIARELAQAAVAAVPPALTWPSDFRTHWTSADLLLSQACGFPLVTFLAGKVRVVGAFHYAAPGCSGALNRSQIVVRASDPATSLADFRGRTVAYNGTDSQSGYNSLRAMVAPLAAGGAFFGARRETGSHLQSVLAVRDGVADIASIDCVSLAGFARHQGAATRGIRVLDQSPPYPGLPLISALHTTDRTLTALRAALTRVVQDPTLAELRQELFITGFEALDASAYRVCSEMRDRATALGCATL